MLAANDAILTGGTDARGRAQGPVWNNRFGSDLKVSTQQDTSDFLSVPRVMIFNGGPQIGVMIGRYYSAHRQISSAHKRPHSLEVKNPFITTRIPLDSGPKHP